MTYKDLNFKVPIESPDYSEASDYAIQSIEKL